MTRQICAWCLSTPPRHDRCQPADQWTYVRGRLIHIQVPCECGCHAEYAQDELW